MGSEEIAKHRRTSWDPRVVCILFCPLVCGILLPVIGIAVLLSKHDLGVEPLVDLPTYPRCTDRLAQRGDTYVRPFGRPHDFGRGGLSHVTLHGAVSHGARELEVWQQGFAPGAGTPIHRHDCEEVFVVLSGNGTMFSRRQGEVAPDAHHFGPNSTIYVPPNRVHQARGALIHSCKGRGLTTAREGLSRRRVTSIFLQLKNTGAETVQVIVTISKPPITVFVYDHWHTPESGAILSQPYLFDRECAADIDLRVVEEAAGGAAQQGGSAALHERHRNGGGGSHYHQASLQRTVAEEAEELTTRSGGGADDAAADGEHRVVRGDSSGSV